jgi:hypothetical protein
MVSIPVLFSAASCELPNSQVGAAYLQSVSCQISLLIIFLFSAAPLPGGSFHEKRS